MWQATYVTMVDVAANKHLDPGITVRAPAGLKDAARNVLAEHNRELRAFIVACLTALRDDPKHFLPHLDPYWPEPKPRGRPTSTRT